MKNYTQCFQNKLVYIYIWLFSSFQKKFIFKRGREQEPIIITVSGNKRVPSKKSNNKYWEKTCWRRVLHLSRHLYYISWLYCCEISVKSCPALVTYIKPRDYWVVNGHCVMLISDLGFQASSAGSAHHNSLDVLVSLEKKDDNFV